MRSSFLVLYFGLVIPFKIQYVVFKLFDITLGNKKPLHGVVVKLNLFFKLLKSEGGQLCGGINATKRTE